MRNMSLRVKLLLIIIVFLCVPFLIVLYIWLQSSSHEIERTASDYGKVVVKQTGDFIDSYFRDLERDTAPLLVMPSIREFMKLRTSNDFEYYQVTNQIDNDFSQSSIYRRGDISTIDFVSGAGITYSSGVFTSLNNGAYERALKQHNSERTYGVGGITIDSSGKPILAYYRYYSDYVYRDAKSMIILYLDLSQITTISRNTLLRESGFLSIVDQDGNYVYYPDASRLGKKADDAYLDMRKSGAQQTIQASSDGKKLIVRLQTQYTNWLLVYEVPLRALSGQLWQMQRITTLLIVCMIVLVLLILGGFAYYLTRRIGLLQKLMRQAEAGDLLVRAPEKSQDELGNLYRSFNKMLTQIRRLIDELNASNAKELELQNRQRETMIQAMQSQINPHFLYNTLEFINSYAILEGVGPISSMALSLSKMFRYSVDNHDPIVTLVEEIRHIRWYGNIVQARSETLRIELAIDEEAARLVACVRLALQPLVENAIRHGYEKHGLEPDFIFIHGQRTAEWFEVRIRDQGAGMDASQIAAYNAAFAMPAESLAETHPSLSGVGIWNVHRRIRLLFGDHYGLRIAEPTGGGFEIGVRLPIMSAGLQT